MFQHYSLIAILKSVSSITVEVLFYWQFVRDPKHFRYSI